MKRALLVVCSLIITIATQAQEIDIEAAKRSAFNAAKSMNDALVEKDFDRYVNYNHPLVLEQVEYGRSGMIMEVAKQINNIEENGNYITAIWAKMPISFVDTADEWQCTLPQFMEYRLPNGKIKSQTTIIGISPDKGAHWYFIDMADRQLSDMKNLFPKLSDRLVINPKVEDEYTPNKPSAN